jgi:hypothetical protein
MVTSRVWFTAEGRALGAIETGSEHFVDLAGIGAQDQGRCQRIVSVHSGIAPPTRRRAPLALGVGEREEISRSCTARYCTKPWTISIGDMSRDRAQWSAKTYRATRADKQAWEPSDPPRRSVAGPRTVGGLDRDDVPHVVNMKGY